MKYRVLGAAVVAALSLEAHAASLDCDSLSNAIGVEPTGYAMECLGRSIQKSGGDPILNALGEGVIGYAAQINPNTEYSPQGLYQFTAPDFAAAQRVGTTSDTANMYGVDFNSASTRLYGAQTVANNAGTRLGVLDIATGAFKTLQLVSGMALRDEVTGMAINPRSGEAWATTVDILTNNPQMSESRLYKLDIATGVMSYVGRLQPDQSNPVFIDIAVNCSGQMYGHNISDDSIYRIDPSNGETTLVGSHGLPANFAQGISFDRSDDQLYGWIYTGGGANTFGNFNLETGAFTALSTGPTGQWEGAIKSECSTMTLSSPDVLTGAWYAPYTTGQGFTARVYGEGDTKTLFMPWFTFSIEGGEGAEEQRWYSLFGQVETGATEIHLPILQTLGGNFDSPPSVYAAQVGTATLKMYSCTEGVLEYQFDAGHNGGAQGRMSMTRLLQTGVDCTDYDGSVFEAEAQYDPVFSGSWYNPETSGQGLELYRVARDEGDPNDPNDNVTGFLYGAWFTFDVETDETGPAGQRWFTLGGQVVDSNGVISTTILRTLNGSFDNEVAVAGAVGTAKLKSEACDRMVMTYEFNESEALGEFSDLSGEIVFRRLGACEADE